MTTLRQAQEAERRIAEAASREVDMRRQTVISSVPVVVFALDTLKIDRAFVSRLNQPDGLAIVQAIVTLVYTLGLEITSEGIETEAQWHELQALGSHLGQGCFFATPQTAEALEARLAALTGDDRRAQTRQAAGSFHPAVEL